MDMIKFARFISYVTAMMNSGEKCLTDYEIEEIKRLLTAEPKCPRVNLQPLFTAMDQGRKIEAIKEFRTLTGEGLKESKDMVEMIMNKFKPEPTLGDILKTAIS